MTFPNEVSNYSLVLRGSYDDDDSSNNYNITTIDGAEIPSGDKFWGNEVDILYYPDNWNGTWGGGSSDFVDGYGHRKIFYNIKNEKYRIHVPYDSRFWVVITPRKDSEKTLFSFTSNFISETGDTGKEISKNGVQISSTTADSKIIRVPYGAAVWAAISGTT
jgi:hypothetical protein